MKEIGSECSDEISFISSISLLITSFIPLQQALQ
jgi:hypothetical protein